MKTSIILLTLLAAVAGSCKNKKNPFDYGTFPSAWTMLTQDADEYYVCDDAEVWTIEENKFIQWYIATGEKWETEISDAYQAGDTVIFNVEESDGYRYKFKFRWFDKDKGIAQCWSHIDEDFFQWLVPNERLSEFPTAECSLDEEETEGEIVGVETRSENPDDLVRSDETISEKIFGDLNHDGENDCVIITKQTKQSAFVTDKYRGELDRNRRGILIAFKKGEHYETVLALPDCFASEHEDGGVYFAPELSVGIERNNLKIHYGHGRYGWWQYLFRYRNSDFELIGHDRSENRGPVVEGLVSMNFLTKKKKTLINTNPDAEGGDEVFDETWQDIELTSGTVKLADITDFDTFSVDTIDF